MPAIRSKEPESTTLANILIFDPETDEFHVVNQGMDIEECSEWIADYIRKFGNDTETPFLWPCDRAYPPGWNVVYPKPERQKRKYMVLIADQCGMFMVAQEDLSKRSALAFLHEYLQIDPGRGCLIWPMKRKLPKRWKIAVGEIVKAKKAILAKQAAFESMSYTA